MPKGCRFGILALAYSSWAGASGPGVPRSVATYTDRVPLLHTLAHPGNDGPLPTLLAGALAEYPRMARMLCWAAVPLGLAALAAFAGAWAKETAMLIAFVAGFEALRRRAKYGLIDTDRRNERPVEAAA